MTIRQFLAILRARRWSAVGVAAAITGLALVVSLLLPRQYTAVAAVLVDVKATDPIFGPGMPGSPFYPGYMTTQADILASDRVALHVVRSMKLDQDPTARAVWLEEGKGRGTIEQFLAEALQRKLDVKPSRESSVMTVRFTGADPVFAAAVANAFARGYVDTMVELRSDPARQSAEWFDARTTQLRERLETAQARLSQFQQRTGIVSMDERLDVETARLNDLSAQVTAIQALRMDSASRERLAQGELGRSPDVMGSAVVQSLRAEIARADARLKELGANLGERHPQVVRAKAELEGLNTRLDLEIRQVARSVGVGNDVNLQREADLRNALEQQRRRVLERRIQRDELALLQRDVEAAQRAYEVALQRLSQTHLESQAQQANVSVLSEALPPTEPSRPRVLLTTLVALFVGSLLGILFALHRELSDRRLRSPSEAEALLTIPLLATLPRAALPAPSRAAA